MFNSHVLVEQEHGTWKKPTGISLGKLSYVMDSMGKKEGVL